MNRIFVPSEGWLPAAPAGAPAATAAGTATGTAAGAGDAPRLRLEGDLVHYLTKVLRLRPGDRFVAASEGGPDRVCVVEDVDRRWLEARVESQRPAAAEAPVKVHLYQGWPKGDKLELIIQKTTELGATAVTPVITERSVPRPSGADRIADKLTRWRAVAREAAEQCGRAVIPAVTGPLTLEAAGQAMTAGGRAAYALWEGEKAAGLLDELGKLATRQQEGSPSTTARPPDGRGVTGVSLLVGPEGGLSSGEVGILSSTGVVPVGLGPRILRTETAAITAVAIVLERLGDLGRVGARA